MPGVSSILGHGAHGDSTSCLLTAHTAFRIPAASCYPDRDYDLLFEHPATPSALHLYDIYILVCTSYTPISHVPYFLVLES